MSDYSNRRRHRRVVSSIPIRISTIEPERDPWTGRPFFRATWERCVNLSRGGAHVQTQEPIAPGRRVIVEFHLPSGKRLEAIGRVAWSKTVLSPRQPDEEDEGGIGVEFVVGATNHFQELEEYISAEPDSITD
jgi:Tfp pilus assembly protein PilZ